MIGCVIFFDFVTFCITETIKILFANEEITVTMECYAAIDYDHDTCPPDSTGFKVFSRQHEISPETLALAQHEIDLRTHDCYDVTLTVETHVGECVVCQRDFV